MKKLDTVRKMRLLEIIRSGNFKSENMVKLLKYSDLFSLSVDVFRSVIERLITLDTEISAAYEYFDEDEWEAIEKKNHGVMNENPEAENKEILVSKNLQWFCNGYFELYKKIQSRGYKYILKLLQPLFRNDTKNIQFLLFKLALENPIGVFGFLSTKSKKDPKTYIPYFSSLAVRIKLSPEIKNRVINAYLRLFTLDIYTGLDLVIYVQYLFYILCFNPDLYSGSPQMKDIINSVLRRDILQYISPNILEKLSEIVDFPFVTYTPTRSIYLRRFPFDIAISSRIQNDISDSYIEFNSSK